MIERNARELVDQFQASEPVDLVDQFATRFPINVIVDMLGLPKRDHQKFHGWYTSIMGFLGNLSQDPDVAAEGMRTKAEFAEYMLPIIQERRQHLGDDLLSTLCAAEIDGEKMDDEEIKAFCSLLLTAGGETTDKSLASLLKNLLQHPRQLEAVRADRSLIPAAFAETLRFSPPVHMIMREPSEDVEMSGGVVEAGKTVTCLISAANRDDRRFDHPDSFDVHRDDLSTKKAFSAAANHLAFCLGRHFCVGAMLAKTEVEVGTNMLLDVMPNMRMEPEFSPPEEGVFTRGPTSMRVEHGES